MPSSQVQRELDLDYAFANTLEVDETTGEDSGVFCWTMEQILGYEGGNLLEGNVIYWIYWDTTNQ